MSSLVIFSFGTYRETNRFKERALADGFVSEDLMAPHSPGELVTAGGIRQVRAAGTETYSFYGLSAKVWGSKLADNRPFKTAFKEWLEGVLAAPAHCVYLTGHHWSHETNPYLVLSWGEDTGHFHMLADSDKLVLSFGVGSDRVEISSANLRSACRLVVGFGCNVATAINSVKYQSFFGSSRPVVLAWDRSISVPRSETESVNLRFFEYLRGHLPEGAPEKDRLEWLYQNHAMELIRAWGHATLNWYSSQARARDANGQFYKFKVDRRAGTAEPVAA